MKMSLKAARVNAGFTLQDVHRMLDISIPTLISWESGKTCPTVLRMRKLCALYRVKIDDIFLPRELAQSEQEVS